MVIEFKPTDPDYQGTTVFTDNSKITNMSFYNDSLPADTPSDKIGLTRDPITNRRYVIEPAEITVKSGLIELKAGGKTPATIPISNWQFELSGIEVFIKENNRFHRGRIYPKK